MIRGWIPCRERHMYLFRNVQTVFGAHPASCSGGTRIIFTGLKRPGSEFYDKHKHTQPPSNCKVNSERSSKCNCSCAFVASTKTTLLLYVSLLSVLYIYRHSDFVVYDSKIVGSNPFRGMNMYLYLRFCAALWNYK